MSQQRSACEYVFWNEHDGREVDVIGEWGGMLHAIEIKLNSTFNSSYLDGLKSFSARCPVSHKCYIVYSGDEILTVQGMGILPLGAAEKVVE